jgi:hypothetical protein
LEIVQGEISEVKANDQRECGMDISSRGVQTGEQGIEPMFDKPSGALQNEGSEHFQEFYGEHA